HFWLASLPPPLPTGALAHSAGGFVGSNPLWGLCYLRNTSGGIGSCWRRRAARPDRYCGGKLCPVYPRSIAAFSVQYGSTRCGRASTQRSARPATRMLCTSSIDDTEIGRASCREVQ